MFVVLGRDVGRGIASARGWVKQPMRLMRFARLHVLVHTYLYIHPSVPSAVWPDGEGASEQAATISRANNERTGGAANLYVSDHGRSKVGGEFSPAVGLHG